MVPSFERKGQPGWASDKAHETKISQGHEVCKAGETEFVPSGRAGLTGFLPA